MTVNIKFKRWRTELDVDGRMLSVPDLAEMLSISRQAIYTWEGGLFSPSSKKLLILQEISDKYHPKNINVISLFQVDK